LGGRNLTNEKGGGEVKECKFCAHITTDYRNKKCCEVYPDNDEANNSFLAPNAICYYFILDLAKRKEYMHKTREEGNAVVNRRRGKGE
jgi:hypothetical protein